MEGATAESTSAADAFMAATADVPETLTTASTGAVAPSANAAPSEGGFMALLTPEMVATYIAMPFETIAVTIGKDGEFWRLKELEKKQLGEAWHPVVARLLEMWGLSNQGPLTMALLLTAMSLTPRLAQERTRRASLKATMRTENSGDSLASSDQPAAANHSSPTDLFETVDDPYGLYPLRSTSTA